ncbi:hypothetical protein MKZ02_20055 [Pseudobacillus sp. FSL P4-0506]
MTIGEQLREKQKKRQAKGKKEEKINWAELMSKKDTYKRVNGRIRRK